MLPPILAERYRAVREMTNVRAHNLNAVNAFVTWEQTVGAAEVNIRVQAISATRITAENEWSSTRAPPTEVTDISMEKAKTDNSITQQASDLYNSVLSDPTLTATEVAVWKARFSKKHGGSHGRLERVTDMDMKRGEDSSCFIIRGRAERSALP